MSAAKRREGAFNCACRAAMASSKVIRHSMSMQGLSTGYVICRAAHTIEVLAIHGHSTASTLANAVSMQLHAPSPPFGWLISS